MKSPVLGTQRQSFLCLGSTESHGRNQHQMLRRGRGIGLLRAVHRSAIGQTHRTPTTLKPASRMG